MFLKLLVRNDNLTNDRNGALFPYQEKFFPYQFWTEKGSHIFVILKRIEVDETYAISFL